MFRPRRVQPFTGSVYTWVVAISSLSLAMMAPPMMVGCRS
jgi:hypothetical protein